MEAEEYSAIMYILHELDLIGLYGQVVTDAFASNMRDEFKNTIIGHAITGIELALGLEEDAQTVLDMLGERLA